MFKKNENYETIEKWIWERTKTRHPHMIILTIGNIVFAGCVVWFSLACRGIIDGAVTGSKEEILHYGIFLFCIILMQLVLRLFLNSLNEFIKSSLAKKLRQETLNQILRKEYESIDHYHSGELVNRMFSDIQVVVDGVIGIVPPFANMVTRLAGAVIILMKLDKSFTCLFLLMGGLIFVITRVFREKMKALHKRVQEEEGKVHAFLQETLENIRMIKASESEARMEEQAEFLQQNHFRAQMIRRTCSITANAGFGFVFQAGYLYALIWGSYGIFNHTMTYGTLTAILQLVGQIQTPFANMSGLLQKTYGMLSSAERLKELYDLPNEKEGENVYRNGCWYEKLKEIRLTDVDFSYGRNAVLKNVNINITPGDFIAVTGLSGGGKSTLFLLLLGIYRPTNGAIQFWRKDGAAEPVGKSTRSLFAYVPQGNALFSGTIRENITFFQEREEDEIKKAAKLACVTDFLEELPEGLDTRIGENGFGLSEGQAQRVAVARALLTGAPILLLDEATSALDEQTEAKLLKNISCLREKTCLIVTHRKAALRICSKCLHLEEGELYETV